MDNQLSIIAAALAFLATISVGGSILAWRAMRRRPLQRRLDTSTETGDVPSVERSSSFASPIIRLVKSFGAGKPSESLNAKLAKAGYHEGSAGAVYLGAKVLLLIIGVVTGGALALTTSLGLPVAVLLAVLCGGVLSFLPNTLVALRRKRRRDEIRAYLPDAVDLLEICVSAGMGLDMAWNAVADEIRGVSENLADEMALTNLEIHLGADRTVAMRHMVERTGVEELASLVAVLVQSDRFGTSTAEALKVFAGSMREGRSQKAEELAEKSAVKLLFPMVLFIFPAILIVCAGPGVLRFTSVAFGE